MPTRVALARFAVALIAAAAVHGALAQVVYGPSTQGDANLQNLLEAEIRNAVFRGTVSNANGIYQLPGITRP
jgi:hypothetical protein